MVNIPACIECCSTGREMDTRRDGQCDPRIRPSIDDRILRWGRAELLQPSGPDHHGHLTRRPVSSNSNSITDCLHSICGPAVLLRCPHTQLRSCPAHSAPAALPLPHGLPLWRAGTCLCLEGPTAGPHTEASSQIWQTGVEPADHPILFVIMDLP